MMLSQNSPVAALPPTNVNRNSTPTKIIRIGTGVLPVSTQTNVSPLVTAGRPSSNPRSNSNSKNLRVIQKLAQENLQPASTNPLRSTSRSASRRKQRRWENSNLFGVQELLSAETFNQMIGASENDKDTFADGTGRHYTRYLFPVDDKKSAFADLFLNRELLNIFRRCEEELTSSSSSRATKHVARSVEEQSWMNMEKKIRTIFLSLLPSNNNSDAAQRRDDALSIQPFVFLLRMEKLLFAFVEDELPKGETVLTAASSSSKRDSSTRQLVSYQVDGERGHLRVDLIESSFYRLLFHGICQFYGLKSQSFVVKNSKHKYIQVNKPKKILAAFDQDVSITKYLYWKILSEDMSNIPDSTSLPAIETLSLSSEVAQVNTILTATALTANDNSSADPVQRASETSTPTLGNASLSTVSLGGDGSRSPPPNDLVRPLIQPETEEQAEDYIVIDMDDLGDGEEEK